MASTPPKTTTTTTNPNHTQKTKLLSPTLWHIYKYMYIHTISMQAVINVKAFVKTEQMLYMWLVYSSVTASFWEKTFSVLFIFTWKASTKDQETELSALPLRNVSWKLQCLRRTCHAAVDVVHSDSLKQWKRFTSQQKLLILTAWNNGIDSLANRNCSFSQPETMEQIH